MGTFSLAAHFKNITGDKILEIPNVPAARNRSETKGMCCERVYRTPAPTNNEHIRNICEEKESDTNATIRKLRIVQKDNRAPHE